MSDTRLHVVKGGDPVLVGDRVRQIVDGLVGDADRSLVLEELDEASYRTDDRPDIARLVDAAQTPPFLTDRRVVVGRELGPFSTAKDVAPLVAYLASPLDTTALVLVWEKASGQQRLGGMPKSLTEAIAAAGGTIHDASVPTGRSVGGWLDVQLVDAGVALDPAAKKLLVDSLGEELGRLPALLATIQSAHGDRKLTPDDIAPYLGEAGTLPPWDLTDAIAAGDIPLAVKRLRRMTGPGDRHPLQLLATLHNHYARLLRLDGANAADDKAAAKLLGLKGSTFPAKKALQQSRRMGGEKIARAIELLAVADLDLRGASAVPGEAVLEVLVARLAQLSR